MRLMFVYDIGADVGSAQDIHNYSRVARSLGHEVTLYGPPGAGSALTYSLDVEAADAVIFILEWELPGAVVADATLAQLVSKTARRRRVVIDNDGMYNDVVAAGGDYNYRDEADSRRRTELCDSLSDKICQPTLHPLRPNVRPFFFHAYNPAWEVPLDFRGKEYGMVYVGNNWFRWRAMRRVLGAIEPIRGRVGRIGLVGYGWDALAWWVPSPLREEACYTEPEYLRELGVELMPPVPVGEVIGMMSRGVFNPVLIRPLFNRLRLVTCRTFETPAANTVPLFAQDLAYIQEVYGERAAELVLEEGDDATERIADVLARPEYHAGIVRDIRRHLAARHSYATRLREMIEIANE